MTTMQNIKKNILSYGLLLVSLCLTGCEDWLDVSPKTQIKSDDNFSTEQGYKDALTGVYLLLTDESLYGKELTFGMLDAMGQYYTGMATNNTYRYDAAFDYENAECEQRINSIWSKAYTALSNDNELIAHIDEADRTIFAGRNYHLIRGEAYALRAFLHFDLIRLWGASYAKDKNHKCIPYMKSVTADVPPLSTVEEALGLCLSDLAVAEHELSRDPVIVGEGNTSTEKEVENADVNYERDRTFKLNYYGVKLLQARIYLYMGLHDEALAAAESVIQQGTFYWTPDEEINVAEDEQRNRIFAEELVFALYDSDLRIRYSSYFTSSNQMSLIMNETSYHAIYELFNTGYFGDYRYAYQNKELDGKRYNTKYMQPMSGNTRYMHRIPLMRLSEAYYIAAECELVANQNIEACIRHLNTVRSHRNLIDDLPLNLTKEEAYEEIRKEYLKEFVCEGQIYYYYKRLNYERIPIETAVGSSISTTYVAPNYTFPLPDDEVEFGERENEK